MVWVERPFYREDTECSLIFLGFQYKYYDKAWRIKELSHGNAGDETITVGLRDFSGRAWRIQGKGTFDISVQAPTTDEIEQFLDMNQDKFFGKKFDDVKELKDSLLKWKHKKAEMEIELQVVRNFLLCRYIII